MAEQLKLFENIIDNLGEPKIKDYNQKPTVEKNQYRTSTKKELKQYEDDLMKKAIQHSSTKHPPLRKETDSERTERYLWQYSDDELKLIKRGKYTEYLKINIPTVDLDQLMEIEKKTFSRNPERPIEEIIKEKADQRLKQEQKAYDEVRGVGGITKLTRPE